LYLDEIDFFVIENYSSSSSQIEKFFNECKNIKGYIQFHENISYKANEIFLKDFFEFYSKYEFITITDCDLEVTNTQQTWAEIKNNLEFENVGVSCIDLSMENFPVHIPGANSWIPDPLNVSEHYIECATGAHLLTIKSKNIDILKTLPFVDSNVFHTVYNMNLKWVKTKINKAKHLTWDLYKQDNEYYQFKQKYIHELWNHQKISNYKIIK
jgi:hypothetical protein